LSHQNWLAFFCLIVRVYLALIHDSSNPRRRSGNKDSFERLLQSMLQLAGDTSDTQSQRASFAFLSKSVNIWGQPLSDATNGEVVPGPPGVPGFERFVYEGIVPTAFAVLSLPDLNVKDGQVIVVC
jgi:exportin-T